MMNRQFLNFEFVKWKKKPGTFEIYLKKEGIDLNSQFSCGSTLLSNAAEFGLIEVVDFLLQKGANGNITNSDGSIPLHLAAMCGHIEIVKKFLALRVFVDTPDLSGNSPLHYVAKKVSPNRQNVQELVHVLVNNNANLNSRNNFGETPLIVSAENSDKQLVELFIRLGANVHCGNRYGWTVLHYSSKLGWETIL